MDATIFASNRLGTLTREQLQAALTTCDLGTLTGATAIAHGLFGQCLFIASTRGDFVLRGCPHNDQQLALEQFIARTLHDHTTVPVAWPYLVVDDPTIFGWPFAIMPRMPGTTANDILDAATTPESERIAIAHAMGDAMAAAAAPCPASGFFDLATHGITPDPEGYAVPALRHIREQLTDALRHIPAATHAEDHALADAQFAAGTATIRDDFPITLCTSDFTAGNITIQRPDANSPWKISGVFDYFEWRAGDPERTLARMLRAWARTSPDRAAALLAGYTGRLPLRPGARERLQLYGFSDFLVIWNYGHTLAKWFPDDLGLRACCADDLAAIGAVVDRHVQTRMV